MLRLEHKSIDLQNETSWIRTWSSASKLVWRCALYAKEIGTLLTFPLRGEVTPPHAYNVRPQAGVVHSDAVHAALANARLWCARRETSPAQSMHLCEFWYVWSTHGFLHSRHTGRSWNRALQNRASQPVFRRGSALIVQKHYISLIFRAFSGQDLTKKKAMFKERQNKAFQQLRFLRKQISSKIVLAKFMLLLYPGGFKGCLKVCYS